MACHKKNITTQISIANTIVKTKTMVLTSAYKLCIVFFVGISAYIKETLKQIDDVCYDRIKVDPELVWGCEEQFNDRNFVFEDEPSIHHRPITPGNTSAKRIRSETFPSINSAMDRICRKKNEQTWYLKTLSQNSMLLLKTLAIICLFEISRVIRETLEQIDDAVDDQVETQVDLWQHQHGSKKCTVSSFAAKSHTRQKNRNTLLEFSSQIPSETLSIKTDREGKNIFSSNTIDFKQFHPRRKLQNNNRSMLAYKQRRDSLDSYSVRFSRASKFKQNNKTLIAGQFSSNDAAFITRRSLTVVLEEDEINDTNER